MCNNEFTTNESCAEMVDCFLKIAKSMPQSQCACIYAKTALFNSTNNVFHFERADKTICIKLIATSKVNVQIVESSRIALIDMKDVVAKLIGDDGTRTDDKLVSLTIQLPL